MLEKGSTPPAAPTWCSHEAVVHGVQVTLGDLPQSTRLSNPPPELISQ